MSIINLITDNIDKGHINLGTPKRIYGGSGVFFSDLSYKGSSLYIQTPLIKTKKGVIDTNNLKYTDLLFNYSSNDLGKNDVTKFIEKFNSIEDIITGKIYNDEWFNNVSIDDVNNIYNKSVKYNKDKDTCVIRCHFDRNDEVLIFDQDENSNSLGDIVGNKIICILQLTGLEKRRTDVTLKILIKQVMVFQEKKEKIFKRCLITKTQTNDVSNKDSSDEINNEINDEINDEINNDNVCDLENIGNKKEPDIEQIENIGESVNLVSEDKDKDNNTLKQDLEEDLKDILDDIITEIPIKKNDYDNLELIETIKPTETETPITLKRHNQVYYDLYREARHKAKKAKKEAIIAYLEAKNIKDTYLLDDLEDLDGSDYDNDDINDFLKNDEHDEHDEHDEDDNSNYSGYSSSNNTNNTVDYECEGDEEENN